LHALPPAIAVLSPGYGLSDVQRSARMTRFAPTTNPTTVAAIEQHTAQLVTGVC
jgi:hypothetical protein